MSDVICNRLPSSLDNDEKWLSLSLKHRAAFAFLVKSCVYSESYQCKGVNLSFGQYLTSQREFLDKFNSTVSHKEDKLSKSSSDRLFKKYKELGLIDYQIINLVGQLYTLITITHTETYNMIKNVGGAAKRISGAGVGHVENILAGQPVGHVENNLNQSHTTTTNGFQKTGKMVSGQVLGHIEKVLNISGGATLEQHQQHPKTMFMKDNVQTMPFANANLEDVVISASRKYKLSDIQRDSLQWLRNQKIDSPLGTLAFWAKTYDLKRLKDIHKAAVKNKPDSIGAYINQLLQNNAYVETDYVRENREFAIAFRQQKDWKHLNVGDKYITCPINGIEKEIPLSYSQNAFVDAIMRLHELYQK